MQNTYKPSYTYCWSKCEFYLDEIDNKRFYCKKAKEVNNYQKKVFVDAGECDEGPVVCQYCNITMVLEYTEQGHFLYATSAVIKFVPCGRIDVVQTVRGCLFLKLVDLVNTCAVANAVEHIGCSR